MKIFACNVPTARWPLDCDLRRKRVGLQARVARIPYANIGMVKLPENVSDDQAILLSDIFPTGWFGADIADIKDGDTVAVFGCGPVGQFAIASAKLMGAGRVIATRTALPWPAVRARKS